VLFHVYYSDFYVRVLGHDKVGIRASRLGFCRLFMFGDELILGDLFELCLIKGTNIEDYLIYEL